MKKWEYKIEPLSGRVIDQDRDRRDLDYEGEYGWELVTIKDGYFIFKRELQE